MPQPYLVPVMPRWSRSTHRRGVSRSASTDMGLPLTFRVIIEELLGKNPPRKRARRKRARQRPAKFSPVLLFLGVRRPALPDYRVERLRRAEKNPVVVPVRQRCERRARLGEEARQAAL